MILCSAFLFAPLAAVNTTGLFGFGFEPAHADLITGNSPNGQTEIVKKKKSFPPANKTLHPAPGFGFILPCRDSRKPSRPS
jgi:hypothetical protein